MQTPHLNENFHLDRSAGRRYFGLGHCARPGSASLGRMDVDFAYRLDSFALARRHVDHASGRGMYGPGRRGHCRLDLAWHVGTACLIVGGGAGHVGHPDCACAARQMALAIGGFGGEFCRRADYAGNYKIRFSDPHGAGHCRRPCRGHRMRALSCDAGRVLARFPGSPGANRC